MTQIPFPPDAYEQIESYLHLLREENQYGIKTVLDYAFSDTNALIDNTLLAFPDFVITAQQAVLLEYAKMNGFADNAFRAFFQQEQLRQLNVARDSVADQLEHMMSYDPFWQHQTEQSKLMIRSGFRDQLLSVQDDNMSQTVRNLQEQTWKQSAGVFAAFVKKFWLKLDQFGWAFALRPLINMNPSAWGTVSQLTYLAGIPAPQVYWTRTMEVLQETFKTLGIYNLIFDDDYFVYESDEPDNFAPAQRNHASFHRWNRLAAYAGAFHPDLGHVLITRTGMPPWLIDDPTNRLPIYTAKPLNACTLLEQAVIVDYVTPDTFSEHVMSPFTLSAEPQMPVIRREIGIGLQIIMMGVTLAASTIRLGSGHRRPTWTAAPMNRLAIQRYLTLLTYATEHLFNA